MNRFVKYFCILAACAVAFASCSDDDDVSSDGTTEIDVDFDLPVLPDDPQPSSTAFHKNLFLIQFTGSSCGYCPLMTDFVNNLAADEDYASDFVLASVDAYKKTDPLYLSNGASIAASLKVSSYPSVSYDMYKTFKDYTAESQFIAYYDETYSRESGTAGICAASTHDDANIVVTVGVKAGTTAKYCVGVWLLEDDLYAYQTNYGTSAGDYNTHNNVVRLASSKNTDSSKSYDYSGVPIGKISAGNTAEYSVCLDLSSSWVLDNMHLVAFVSAYSEDDSAYYVVNAVDVPFGEAIAYQYE